MLNSVYRSFNQDSLNTQYRASATVPDLQIFIDEYASLSKLARDTLNCITGLKYGQSEEETLDLFPVPDSDSYPLFVFIHGGYWRMLSKDESSFMAPNLVKHGIGVAAINYTLAPTANIDQIVDECRRSIQWLYNNAKDHGIDPNRIFVGGSSAGGHLTGMMVAGGWHKRYDLPRDVVKGGVPISGLFDMEPIVKCFVNEWMQMSLEDGLRNSPDRNLPEEGCPLIVAVGVDETEEFRRQSRDFANLWSNNGWDAEFLHCDGTHHFNAPLELCKPFSVLMNKVLTMISP